MRGKNVAHSGTVTSGHNERLIHPSNKSVTEIGTNLFPLYVIEVLTGGGQL
jgi:hypothetical protein